MNIMHRHFILMLIAAFDTADRANTLHAAIMHRPLSDAHYAAIATDRFNELLNSN